MPGSDTVDDPQNALHQRLFLIRPRARYFTDTGLPTDHPSAQPEAILTPRLPFETWYEGWQLAWRQKAKQDFITGFAGFWGTSISCGYAREVPADFIQRLTAGPPAWEVFDHWWSLEEYRSVREMDSQWRPDQPPRP